MNSGPSSSAEGIRTQTVESGLSSSAESNRTQTWSMTSLRTKIASLPLFMNLRDQSLDFLADELRWLSLPGGSLLFAEGEPGDAVYVVLSGRLGVLARDRHGREALFREIGAGETVGEMAVLTGEPRSASVVALRDTELVSLTKPVLMGLIEKSPQSIQYIATLLSQRLRRSLELNESNRPRAVALVSLSCAIDAADFAHSLERAMNQQSYRSCVLDRESSSHDLEWFGTVADAHDMVLYQADREVSPWTRLCLRSADRILLLFDASQSVAETGIDSLLDKCRPDLLELVMVHGDTRQKAPPIAELLKRYRASSHWHVQINRPRDFARLARLVLGRAIGLVLSGGGARGLAHLGAIRALREVGLELDLFGGASMGAVVAAGAALERDDRELRELLRETLLHRNPLSDYTLPIISLFRGRRLSRILRQQAGDARVEDCWHPFFCTSTNLTSGQLHVHQRGPLWRAVRASIAIPGVLPPVIEGNEILVDSGVLNNMPVDIMSAMRRGPVIGVDVATHHCLGVGIGEIEGLTTWQLLSARRRGGLNIVQLLMHSGTVSCEAHDSLIRSKADLLIEPRLENIGMLEWKAFDAAVEAGYRDTRGILERNNEVLQRLLGASGNGEQAAERVSAC